MTEHNDKGLRRIRRALLSVSDKTGLIEFAQTLRSFDIKLLSTGGTARALREAGLEVRDVADVTGFPEMLDGRVKTLHPRIHGGLLAIRDNVEHTAALTAHDIEPIDLVVINLYPFEQTIARDDVTLAEAIEQIDIGGPAMIRSAAKNYTDVAVVVSPDVYAELTTELNHNGGALSLPTRGRLAWQAYQRTAEYDMRISSFLGAEIGNPQRVLDAGEGCAASVEAPHNSIYPLHDFKLGKIRDLRYGENPHQFGALYEFAPPNNGEEKFGVAHAELLSGKEMSFNNYVDADAAWQLVCDFDEPACAIIKHMNPAGVGSADVLVDAYRRALATDPVSAFGSIVAFNRKVDEAAAQAVTEVFTEVLIAPDFDEAALATLQKKKNLRLLRTNIYDRNASYESLDYRRISGGMLVQTRDTHRLTRDALKVVSKRAPSEEEIAALLFAWTVCKHAKSNAIVYARAGQTIGVGAGQMSRVDSVRLGALRAQLPVNGSVLASDAFFPFRDGIDEAAKHGITAIIQPGGSVRDAAVIAAADEHKLAMVFTGVRHFKH